MYGIPMGCMPWYGDLGDRWLPGRDMMKMVVLYMLQGCLQYVEELTSWMRQLLLILVDGYQDGMLPRTTTISGGGGCNDLQFLGAWVDSACARVGLNVRFS